MDINISTVKDLKQKNLKNAHHFKLDSTYLHVNHIDRAIEISDQTPKPKTYRILQGTQLKFNDKGSWQIGGGASPSYKSKILNEKINFPRRTSA